MVTSPLQQINLLSTTSHSCKIFLKRDDLLNTPFNGNKWRKLKYFIQYVYSENINHILTWAGPYSNYLLACASLVEECNLQVTCYIPHLPKNEKEPPSLVQARAKGIAIREISRTEFRKRFDPNYILYIKSKNRQSAILAEGGTSQWSDQGVAEMVEECSTLITPIHYWVVPVGTGGTLRGMISTRATGNFLGINVIKKSNIEPQIQEYLKRAQVSANWEINSDYTFGGMGYTSEKLIQFINSFYERYTIKLDPIYNGKMMYAVNHLLNSGYFRTGSTICITNTGGQAGIDNFNFKYPGLLNF